MTAAGHYRRPPAAFRHRVTADGSSGFPAAARRYRLYVSYACPWAHRVLIVRSLKRLDGILPVTVVEPVMDAVGWCLPEGGHLRDVYRAAEPRYEGRASVPLLVDETTGCLVNNESADLMRLLNDAFNAFGDADVDLVPPDHKDEIGAMNTLIHEAVNDGVYKAGFATGGAARGEALDRLFDTLRDLDARLDGRPFLLGEHPLEPDWRLWPTLVRYDPVYRPLLLGTGPELADFRNLARFADRLLRVPGIAATWRVEHAIAHFTARTAGARQVRLTDAQEC